MKKFYLKFKTTYLLHFIVFLVYVVVMLVIKKYDYKEGLFYQRFLVGIGCYVVTTGLYSFLRWKDQSSKMIEVLIRYRYFLCGVYLILFCLLGVHGFSIDMWTNYLPSSSTIATKLFGFNRPVTSDVWAIGIPQILNQIEVGAPLFNTTTMSQGGNMVLGGVFAFDLTMLGQPHYWGCFFGENFGLAWLYWFKKFALLLSVYEVMYFLLRGKKKFALIGSLIIVCSPLLNWWFGHTVTVVVIYMHWCVACVIGYLYYGDTKLKKVGFATLGVIGAIGFILGWYPALQVPFGYLALILIGIIIISYMKQCKEQKKASFEKVDCVVIGTAILVIGLVVARFLMLSVDSITQLTDTVFPGKRISIGGNYLAQTASYYLFQPLFAKQYLSFSNECEASSIMPFIPLIYLLVPMVVCYFMNKKESLKAHIPLIILFLYEVFLTSWLFVSYPEWFAKVTLFQFVTEGRCVWIIAIISVYLGMILLSELCDRPIFNRRWSVAIAGIVTGSMYLFIRKYLDYEFLNFHGIPAQIIIAGAFGAFFVFLYWFINGKKKIVFLFLIIMCIGFEMTINPIQMGTAAITETQISKEIKKIAGHKPESYWMAEGGFVLGNFVYAHGVKTFNCTNQYMDLEKWAILDESDIWEDIYNRYAQVQVEIVEEDTRIELISADLIQVYLNTAAVAKLNINYIMSTRDLENMDTSKVKFQKIYTDEDNGQMIYEVINK